MSLRSRKAGNQFSGLKLKRTGTLTPEEWATWMVVEGFPMNPKVIAEGLGILYRESRFNASSKVTGNEHMGGWAESAVFGSEAERLDAQFSTRAARKQWEADGKTFYNAWGRWQLEQGGVDGSTEYQKYLSAANAAIRKGGGAGTSEGGGGGGWISGFPDPGDLIEGAGEVAGAALDAGEFLAEMAATILNFRKLGQLAAEALAWFIRLILKAIWTYVIAPLVHWSERAVTWYWRNFFTVGTERGSGVGHVLRQNAGIITITFWALGYAILWSDGQSLAPAPAKASMLGQGVKGIEGKIARRSLVRPEKVNAATPDKPKPKTSTVQIERVTQFSVARKRPITVTQSGGNIDTGRQEQNGSNQGSKRVPRPGQTQRQGEATPEIILPEGVKKPEKQTAQTSKAESVKTESSSTKPRRAGVGS